MYIRLENMWCIYVFFIAHLKDSLWNQFISEVPENSTITLTCGRYITKPFCRTFLYHWTGFGAGVRRKGGEEWKKTTDNYRRRASLIGCYFHYFHHFQKQTNNETVTEKDTEIYVENGELCMCSIASSYVQFGCDQCDISYVLSGLQLFIRYMNSRRWSVIARKNLAFIIGT